MSDGNDVVTTLITGGIGATMGTIITAIIQSISKRSESRAIAADRVTNAAGNLADRLDKINGDLESENRHMREALIALAEGIEEMLPLAQDEETRMKIRETIKIARVAFR